MLVIARSASDDALWGGKSDHVIGRSTNEGGSVPTMHIEIDSRWARRPSVFAQPTIHRSTRNDKSDCLLPVYHVRALLERGRESRERCVEHRAHQGCQHATP